MIDNYTVRYREQGSQPSKTPQARQASEKIETTRSSRNAKILLKKMPIRNIIPFGDPVSRAGHQISRIKTTLNLLYFENFARLRRLSSLKEFQFLKLDSPFLNACLYLGFSKKHTLNESGGIFWEEEGLTGLIAGSVCELGKGR